MEKIKTKLKEKLEITGIKGLGRIEKIYLTAQAGINLKNYLIYDTTFTADGKPSNKGRHVFPLPDYEVDLCQEIVIVITSGIKTKRPQTIYWNRSSPVINDTGDHLVLVKIENEQRFQVAPK